MYAVLGFEEEREVDVMLWSSCPPFVVMKLWTDRRTASPFPSRICNGFLVDIWSVRRAHPQQVGGTTEPRKAAVVVDWVMHTRRKCAHSPSSLLSTRAFR